MMGGGFLMVLIWLLVIAGGIGLFRMENGHGNRAGQGEKTALDLLAERYARGEISQEEFVRMREQLRQ